MADLPQPTAKTLAGRQNGARSRGPRTVAGKARSARNALTHGLRARRLVLLDDEDAAEFRAFATALQAELAPEGRLQADLVGRIVMAAWRARRADKLEAGPLGTYLAGASPDPDPRAFLAPSVDPWWSARSGKPRNRLDPGQLWPARVRHSGPLSRPGAGGMARRSGATSGGRSWEPGALAGGAQAAPGRGAWSRSAPTRPPSRRPPGTTSKAGSSPEKSGRNHRPDRQLRAPAAA